MAQQRDSPLKIRYTEYFRSTIKRGQTDSCAQPSTTCSIAWLNRRRFATLVETADSTINYIAVPTNTIKEASHCDFANQRFCKCNKMSSNYCRIRVSLFAGSEQMAWHEVVKHPLGLAGFALAIIIGFAARLTSDERKWLRPIIGILALAAMFGGVGLAYYQTTLTNGHLAEGDPHHVASSSVPTPPTNPEQALNAQAPGSASASASSPVEIQIKDNHGQVIGTVHGNPSFNAPLPEKKR